MLIVVVFLLSNVWFLLIWPRMHSTCYFRYVFVCSVWTFLRFCTMVFLGFLLLSLYTFSCFSVIAIDSQKTPHFSLGLVCVLLLCGSRQNFHICHSHCVFQMSDEENQTCFLQLPYIDYLYHRWKVRTNHIVNFYFVSYSHVDSGESLLRKFCDQKILLFSSKCYLSSSCL